MFYLTEDSHSHIRTLWLYPDGDTEESRGCLSLYLSNEEKIFTFFKTSVCHYLLRLIPFLILGWTTWICQETLILFRSSEQWRIVEYPIWRYLIFTLSASWWWPDEVYYSFLSFALFSHNRGERRMIRTQLISESTGFLNDKGELTLRLHLYTKTLINIVNSW